MFDHLHDRCEARLSAALAHMVAADSENERLKKTVTQFHLDCVDLREEIERLHAEALEADFVAGDLQARLVRAEGYLKWALDQLGEFGVANDAAERFLVGGE